MEKEKIIQLARNEKDERLLAIQVKARDFGNRISSFFAALIVLILVVDGYLLENNRNYDLLTVASMLIGTCTLNFAARNAYEIHKAEKRSKIFDVILHGIITIFCIVRIVLFYIG